MSTRRFLSFPVLTFALLIVLALPAAAEAQRRGPVRGHAVRSVVIVSGGFGYPSYWFYDQWGPYGPWGPYGRGPYGPWGPYPRYYRMDEFTASVKFDVKPKDAEVYVDGSLAGQIDDFDGIFQELRLRPGGHEIVVYRDGFRAVHEQLYFEPYEGRKLRFNLDPLAPGEPQEPRPQAPPPGAMREDPRGREMPRQGPPPPPEPRPAPQGQFGTLSIRVLPADAEIVVDGERWTGPVEAQRLNIQLAPGRHRVEVRKGGFATYSEDVLIRPGATLTLNVSLK